MRKAKFKVMIAAIFMCSILAVGMISPANFATGYAAESKYTSVIEDLSKDENFDIADYPAIASDYSVYVKHIAESANGELFIYTYQPSRESRALSVTSVNMALTSEFENTPESSDIIDTDNGYYQGSSSSSGGVIGGGIGGGFGGSSGGGGGGGGSRPASFSDEPAALSAEDLTQTKLYGLTLLSSSGTLCKYKVKDFTVSADKIRYYYITSIFRAWDPVIDGVQTGNQIVTEKAYAVGQLWTVGTFGNIVHYDVEEVEVITVTAQMVGVQRYSEGFKFMGTYTCDSHYLAFSCDHAIDRLISADISFYTRNYRALAGSGTQYEGKVEHNVTLYDYEKAGTDSTGWFNGGNYVWDRMSSTAEYVTNLRNQGYSITDEEVNKLMRYDWILNFYETEYKCEAGGKDVLISCLIPFGFVWTIVNACTTTGTIVSDVALMRLEFEYGGKIYNLGVVSDRQTGIFDPDSMGFFEYVWNCLVKLFNGSADLIEGIVAIVAMFVALVVLSFVMRFLGIFFPPIWDVCKTFWKGLLLLITAPFRGIAALVRKIGGG